MNDKIGFPAAIVDEKVYLIPSPAKLTISAINANLKPINLSNFNGTVILYAGVNGGDISADGLEAIYKLIGAVKLNPEETICLRWQEELQLTYQELKKTTSFTKLICFGVEMEKFGLHLQFRKHIYFIFNDIDMIICDNIVGMETDKRKLLWSQLKIMYKI